MMCFINAFKKINYLLIFSLLGLCESSFICKEETLQMCTCDEYQQRGHFVVDCSNTGLKSVPKGIPTKTTHLYLDKNNIKVLYNGELKQSSTGLPNLVVFSIKQNLLEKLDIGVFTKLHSLEELYLYNNKLELEDSLPKSVFIPLSQSLKVLDIRMNLLNDNLNLVNYPVPVSELYNLVELRMDCLRDKPLPQEYGNIRHLQRIVFTNGRQDVISMKDNAFDSISRLNIMEINLVGLNIRIIGPHTFSKLKHLKKLDLSNNPRLDIHISDIASSLHNTSISILRLNNTGIGNSPTPTASILKQFCGLHLKELTLDQNYIHNIDLTFSNCFSDLNILSVGDNYLVTPMLLVQDIMLLKDLIGFNMSYQNRIIEIAESITINKSLNTLIRDQLFRDKQALTFNESILNRGKRNVHMCEKNMACPFSPAPKLQWIDASHNGLFIVNVPEVVLLRNSTLKFFKASYCGIQTMTLPIYCPFDVIPRIETLDISSNNLQCINESIFNSSITGCNWYSLKEIYLRNNKLGQTGGNICNHDKKNIFGFLKPLINVAILDISSNKLLSDHRLADLQTLVHLQHLDLSSNGFHNFSLSLDNFTKLTKLNLSFNNLQCLYRPTIRQLDRLQKLKQKQISIKVDLSGNMLSCKCECFYFLQWIRMTDVVLVNNKTYQCIFDDGRVVTLNRLSFIIAELESLCYGTSWLQLCIGLETSTYLLIIIVCSLYRWRHYIKYFFLKIKLNRHKLEGILHKKNYKFSAFISCERRDAKDFVYRKLLPKLETKETKLKFCIAQRNFLVGATIMSNILKATHSSRKVIFIVSEYFLKSDWCKEELIIAHQVSLERGENMIICIFMPNVKEDKLPPSLQMIIKTVNCLKWPLDPSAQKVFWFKLQRGLEEAYVENPNAIV